jgi:hypothetical protein
MMECGLGDADGRFPAGSVIFTLLPHFVPEVYFLLPSIPV